MPHTEVQALSKSLRRLVPDLRLDSFAAHEIGGGGAGAHYGCGPYGRYGYSLKFGARTATSTVPSTESVAEPASPLVHEPQATGSTFGEVFRKAAGVALLCGAILTIVAGASSDNGAKG